MAGKTVGVILSGGNIERARQSRLHIRQHRGYIKQGLLAEIEFRGQHALGGHFELRRDGGQTLVQCRLPLEPAPAV